MQLWPKLPSLRRRYCWRLDPIPDTHFNAEPADVGAKSKRSWRAALKHTNAALTHECCLDKRLRICCGGALSLMQMCNAHTCKHKQALPHNPCLAKCGF